MKKTYILLLILCFAVITGCSGTAKQPVEVSEKKPGQTEIVDLTFQGESDNWSVRLDYSSKSVWLKQKFENEINEKATVRYKGSDVKSVRDVYFWIQTDKGGIGGGNKELSENGIIVVESNPKAEGSPSGSVSTLSKNSTVKAKIDWNGKSKTIDMQVVESK